MFFENFRLALSTIRQNKIRSTLTALGVIIAVWAVVLVVSIGNGIKSQINNEISGLGSNLITITPGKTVTKDKEGEISKINFAGSMTTTLRAVNTKEMLDIRQQAEFFMTLGQHQEAVDILAENIDAGLEANPLVYLDLLKVLHTLGRKAGYDHYRNAFNAIFSGRVPEYAGFNHGGDGLEAHPDVCRRIVQLWPSEEAVA